MTYRHVIRRQLRFPCRLNMVQQRLGNIFASTYGTSTPISPPKKNTHRNLPCQKDAFLQLPEALDLPEQEAKAWSSSFFIHGGRCGGDRFVLGNIPTVPIDNCFPNKWVNYHCFSVEVQSFISWSVSWLTGKSPVWETCLTSFPTIQQANLRTEGLEDDLFLLRADKRIFSDAWILCYILPMKTVELWRGYIMKFSYVFMCIYNINNTVCTSSYDFIQKNVNHQKLC